MSAPIFNANKLKLGLFGANCGGDPHALHGGIQAAGQVHQAESQARILREICQRFVVRIIVAIARNGHADPVDAPAEIVHGLVGHVNTGFQVAGFQGVLVVGIDGQRRKADTNEAVKQAKVYRTRSTISSPRILSST